MKRVIKKSLLLLICLSIAIMTASAAERWIVGVTFNEEGKTFYREVGEKSGTLECGVYVYDKYTNSPLQIYVRLESKGLFGWSTHNKQEKSILIPEGTGSGSQLVTNPAVQNLQVKGTKNIRYAWEQKTFGNMTAELIYTK